MSRVTLAGLAGLAVCLLLATAAGPVITRLAASRYGFEAWKLLAGKAHGSGYADVDGVSIYYETFGSGPPVLVLHGGLGCLEDMRHQIIALAGEHFVIAPDSRGHGRSTDTAAPLTYAGMADDMVGLLDRLKIDRVDVVGWSDGGIIGLDLAMRYPGRIRRLVAISANSDVDGLVQLPPADGPVPPRRRACPRPDADPNDWPTFYRKVVTLWRTQPHYSQKDLGQITAPTLIMAGDADVVRRSHTDLLTKAIPGAREFIIEGGSHSAYNDSFGIVNTAVSTFLHEPLP